MGKNKSGFTIVELLIVIVVIGILAAITIVAYNGVQTRAKASSIASELKHIDKGLRLVLIDNGQSTWPLDSAIDPPKSNPAISVLITDTTLKNYLQTPPDSIYTWTYDNDGDIKPDCGLKYNGTNVVVTGIDQTTADAVDAAIDDSDEKCGRVRYDASASKLFYSLSYSSEKNG